MEKKNKNAYFFYLGRGTHWHTWRWYVGNKITMRGSVLSCPGGLGFWCRCLCFPWVGKETYRDISKVCYARHILGKSNGQGSLQVQIDFANEPVSLGHDCPPWPTQFGIWLACLWVYQAFQWLPWACQVNCWSPFLSHQYQQLMAECFPQRQEKGKFSAFQLSSICASFT